MGQKTHDAVKVPFVLLPEAQNEGQFAFMVDKIIMPQKMRGTLTYILKVGYKTNQSSSLLIHFLN